MSETPGTENSRREALVWVAVLSIPPGVGMVGFVAVAVAGGAVTPGALVAGLLTTLTIGGLLYAALQFGPDDE